MKKYQEIDGVKYEFDDKKTLREMFELLGKMNNKMRK
jgi:hypothetical protein